MVLGPKSLPEILLETLRIELPKIDRSLDGPTIGLKDQIILFMVVFAGPLAIESL